MIYHRLASLKATSILLINFHVSENYIVYRTISVVCVLINLLIVCGIDFIHSMLIRKPQGRS